MTTYIKNTGITQTFFQDNHQRKKANEVKWDAKYDGNLANIKVDVKNNGKKNKYRMQFNNEDLANILSVPVVNQPLEKRLYNDFLSDDDNESFLEEEFMIPQMEPKPALFRVNIPELDINSKTQQYPSPFSSLSELTSPSSSESILSELDESLYPKLSQREKIARIKTPSPKTLRIHYTSPTTTASGRGKGTRSKRHAKQRQTQRQRHKNGVRSKSKVAKFFRKLF